MEDDLIKVLGGPTTVSRLAGVKVPTVIGWKGRIPPERCPAIELGRPDWPCERLRPDVKWARVPDPDWPHPGGRPVHDFARREPEAA
jgi:DNA-binding transcriptional regulator YdaS (Cro superfamily)